MSGIHIADVNLSDTSVRMQINWWVDQPRVDLKNRAVLKSICAHHFYNRSFTVEQSIGSNGEQHLDDIYIS